MQQIKRCLKCAALGAAVWVCAVTAGAKTLSLPLIFSEHMVLAADAQVPVWGRAEPGARVTVAIAGQTVEAVAAASGRWEAALAPVCKGGPYVMTVSDGSAELTVGDVLFGEVWLASGQSNMGINVGMSDGAEEGLKQVENLQVRFFAMPISLNVTPQDDLAGGRWIVCTPENSAALSAVGYYFACELGRTLSSPVAVVHAAWGGSRIQNWMPYSALESHPDLRGYADQFRRDFLSLPDEQKTPDGLTGLSNAYKTFNDQWVKYQKTKTGPAPVPPATPRPRHAVALNYNAMIHPLAPFAIKGVLWYQGESNTNEEDAPLYAEMLSSMIRSWRALWNSDFLFIFAQLPEYKAENKEEFWICVRDQQRKTFDRTDNTAMVMTLGYGNLNDIHPLNKRPVGEMMAHAALSKAYQQNVPWCGPLVHSAVQQESRLILSFETFGRTLQSSSPELAGFEISFDGKTFQSIPVKIENNQVVIAADQPVRFVRYGWDVNPVLTLHDDAGLPASPFLKEVN